MKKRVILALATVAVLTGCQKKAEGQAVAVVNDEEITAVDLNNELRTANIPQTANKDEARNAMLQRLIDRKLLVQQARKDELDQTPEYLTQQRQMTDNLLINLLLSRQMNTAQLPSADAVAKYESSRPGSFANRQIWTLDQMIYPTVKDPAILKRIAGTTSFVGVQQVLSSAGIKFEKASRQLDTAMFPNEIYARVNALPAGMPFVVPGGDRTVASVVTQRQPAPRAGAEARPMVLNMMRNEQGQKVLQDKVKAARTAAKIEYQKGYAPAAAPATAPAPAKK